MEQYDLTDMKRYVQSLQSGIINAEHRGEGVWGPARVPVMSLQFTQQESGLIVPQSLLRSPTPLDYVKTYLIDREIFGASLGVEAVNRLIGIVPLDNCMIFGAEIMARLRNPNWDQSAVSAHYARIYMEEPFRTRVLNTLATEPRRILIAPQAIYTLMKRSLELSPDGFIPATPDFDPNVALMTILMGVAGTLGGDNVENEREIDDIGWIGRHLAANQYLNDELAFQNLLAMSHFRWFTYAGDLRSIYRDTVGVDAIDVMTLGLLLWSQAIQSVDRRDVDGLSAPIVSLGTLLEPLNWDEDRVADALNLFCADHVSLRTAVLEDEEAYGAEWSNSAFERFPVLMGDRHLLIIDPHLLIKRVFGKPLYFDAAMSPNLRGANKVKALFEKSAEAYVETILSAICGDGDRVYDERSVKRALGRNRVKIADAAIDYGTSWVVVETTTSQITRESVGGTSEESLSRDINKLVDNKVVQLSSTVDELRERGQMLCGYESTAPRRFYPILAMADGFPVNPVTVTAIRERATLKGLLTGADVAALEILDLVELEMIEGAMEVSGLTMPQILDGKSRSELWRDSVQHYILSELQLSPPVPARVRAGFHRIFEILVEPLRPDR